MKRRVGHEGPFTSRGGKHMFTMKNGSPRVVLFVPLLKLESNEYPSSVCL